MIRGAPAVAKTWMAGSKPGHDRLQPTLSTPELLNEPTSDAERANGVGGRPPTRGIERVVAQRAGLAVIALVSPPVDRQ